MVHALLAALAFGLTIPAVKAIVGDLPAVFLAGWLYAASGVALALARAVRPSWRGTPIPRRAWPWLAGAILAGGVLAPYAQVRGIALVPGHVVSLLTNLEVVFTVLFAVLWFGERLDLRRAAGVILLLLAGALASDVVAQGFLGAHGEAVLWFVAAGAFWGLDNNLTRRIADCDAVEIAKWKGLLGGGASLAIAAALGLWPSPRPVWLAAAAIGVVGYGLSLVLFVKSLRTLGAARGGAVFIVCALVVGVLASALFLGERLSPWTPVAGVLVVVGVLLAASTPKGTDPAA